MQDGEISLGDGNILRAWAAPGSEDTVEEAREQLNIMRKPARGRRLPALAEIRKIKSTSREARQFYGCEEYAKIVCAAAIIASPVSQVIGNFYLDLNRGVYPLKLFLSEDLALDWLKGFL